MVSYYPTACLYGQLAHGNTGNAGFVSFDAWLMVCIKIDAYQSWWQKQSRWEYCPSRLPWLRWGWLRMCLLHQISYVPLTAVVLLFFLQA